jgi:hypothetical protein
MVPDFLHGAPPTDACAAFIEESRMKFVNAGDLDRKSGCTLWRTWGTRPEPKDRRGEIVRRDRDLLVQYLARDNQALYLAGTFADGAEFNISVELLDRVVFDETVTTVKLHCLIADPDRHLTGH